MFFNTLVSANLVFTMKHFLIVTMGFVLDSFDVSDSLI